MWTSLNSSKIKKKSVRVYSYKRLIKKKQQHKNNNNEKKQKTKKKNKNKKKTGPLN